uniref:Uncharacterized protein n=1 Tax=Anguilla anguilla TaxID=7936 RepID=A0A0E9XUY2_ANGAN
MIHRCLLET